MSVRNHERDEKTGTGKVGEVANLGIIRPPFVYLCAIVVGVLLHFAWPLRLVSRAVGVPFGGTAVLVAIALFMSATRTFRTAGTPVPGNLPTSTIVRTGPYRFSVNLYNITDRLNYSQVFGNRATPAAGRTFIFALGATF